MSDHPTTFRGGDAVPGAIEWNDRAELQRVGDGDGLFDKAKGLRSGTFAELVRHVMLLPKEERGAYEIVKAGDRKYSASEAAALAARNDFPSGKNAA